MQDSPKSQQATTLLCLNFLPRKDSLQHVTLMKKVADLLAEEFPVIVHEDHTHTY